MSWHRYVWAALAGITLSTALAQTPTSTPPARSKSSAKGSRTPLGTPPLQAPGTSPGQSTGIPGGTVPGPRPTTRGTTPTNRREPCWQVAGVSKAAMEQRRVVAQQTRQEVEAVCANASLSPAQKQERIREIHQQERQHMEALITPQQREAMHVCQQQRSGGTHLGGGHLGGGHGMGPCGTLPGFPKRANESEPEDTAPKN
ncbi:MAG: hypothetical protein WAQ52_10755 [Terriglobales bacterium]